MAIPKIKQILLTEPSTVLLYFDAPLDEKVPVPLCSFTVNYGQVGVSTVLYCSDTIVTLGLDTEMCPHDSIFVSYEPPLELARCLRGPVPNSANEVVIKRNAVRAFYRVSAINQLAPDERIDGTRADSNLGANIGGYGYPHPNRSGVNVPGGNDPRSATPDDFVLAYGLKEAIQLTNIDDASATTVNVAKLQMAIQDANALIDSYIIQSGKAGMVLITSNRRRTALIIARYYLDSVRRREDVRVDYEVCLKQLQAEMAMSAVRAGAGDSAIDTPHGILRSWRIPQRYNSVSGKGLSGWNTDTAGDQARDWRQGWGTIGQNLECPNWLTSCNMQDLAGGATPQIIEPTDAGGCQDDCNNAGWA